MGQAPRKAGRTPAHVRLCPSKVPSISGQQGQVSGDSHWPLRLRRWMNALPDARPCFLPSPRLGDFPSRNVSPSTSSRCALITTLLCCLQNHLSVGTAFLSIVLLSPASLGPCGHSLAPQPWPLLTLSQLDVHAGGHTHGNLSCITLDSCQGALVGTWDSDSPFFPPVAQREVASPNSLCQHQGS